MQCPKCGHDQAGVFECERCGVIFSKVRDEPPPDEAERQLADRVFRPALEVLLEPRSLNIQQDPRELLEVLTSWEVANEYTLRDGSGMIRGFAVEQGRGARAMLHRSFLGSHRSFHIAVLSSSEREVILDLQRPFVFWFSQTTVEAGGRKLGTVVRRFSWLHRTYDLQDGSGRVFAKIVSPLLKIWTFTVFDLQGRQRAEIKKKWGGATREYFTDADRFRLSFSDDALTADQKAVILGAALSIDFDFFENNNQSRR